MQFSTNHTFQELLHYADLLYPLRHQPVQLRPPRPRMEILEWVFQPVPRTARESGHTTREAMGIRKIGER